ncbi:MAG TPA: carboxypeptidase-like regulatory domain-containing protein [Candidatus Polarisedimenticolia bacterium]|nr:carboxypeptidase-like regulatory domain-containing protein [Candidatus Polarisedimenticolia bacterium]
MLRPGCRPAAITLLALCLGVAVAVVPHGLQAQEMESIQVRGRVTDATGAAVPGHSVRLLKSRTIVNLGTFKKRDQNVEELSSTTDAHGFFEFKFPLDKKFRHYYLRFYDPDDFDLIKYRLPADKDISSKARKARAVQADVILELQPGWPEVEALIRQYGPGTQRAQILRALGLPSRRVPQSPGREVWEYDAAGIAYLIEGEKVVETRRDHGARRSGVDGAAVPVNDAATNPKEGDGR